MTFRFGNDETLETRTLAFLPVGIAEVNGVLRVYVVPGERRTCCRKNFRETSVATMIWVAGTCSLSSRRICFYPRRVLGHRQDPG